MDMDIFKNNIREKTQRFLFGFKTIYANTYSKLVVFFQKITANKKLFLITVSSVVVVVLIVAGLSYFFLGSSGEQSIFSIFKKGELVGTGEGVGQTVWLGNSRITLFGAGDGSYRPLELDEAGKRVTRGYFGADIEVYNTDLNITDFLIYGLTDDLGNEYERDFDIEFYLDDIQDLGVAKNYVPQTLRRGYLLFPPIDERAKKLELTVFSEIQNKKIIFEIER